MTFNISKYHDELCFVTLGGTNEIGMNLNAYQYKGKWIIVDFGLGFSEKDFPGIDIVLPLTTFLEQHKENILGMLLTHAHLDHIGAVPYLANVLGCPLYTTKFTKSVIESSLREFSEEHYLTIHEVQMNNAFDLGPFSIELLQLAHSTLEMCGMMIRTERGNVFHTGDWKLGGQTNEDALKKLGDEGILAVMCDSTNIFTPGVSGSETALAENLTKIIKEYKGGLIVITTFASNIERLHNIAKAAKESGRRVALIGRSLWRLYQCALECGYMEDIEEFLPAKAVKSHKKEEILVICTGCQGEELAATTRMSKDEHPDISVNKGDMIIFSSKIIPGNEKKIYNLFNRFCKMGIEVMTERDHFVHVSGHPSRDEVKAIYKLLRPEMAVPVHGEPMHIHEHCKFAKDLGVKHTIQVENGDVVVLSGDKPGKIGSVEFGYLAVDGNMIIDEFSTIIRDRREMRSNGLAVVLIIVNQGGKLIRQPKIFLPGIIDIREDGELLDIIVEEVRDAVNSMKLRKRDDRDAQKSIVSLMKKLLRKYRNKSPHIVVHIEYISL